MGNGDDSTLLSTADLLNFNNSVIQSNPLGMAGQALGAWQPNMSTWSPAASGLTAFGKTFLSSFLQNQARSDAANQLQSVVTALPQLRSDPYNTAIPEGVDSDAFNVLKGSAILKNEALKTNRANAISDLLQQVGVAGLKKKAEILAENEAYQGLDDGGGSNPNSPQYKRLQDETNRSDKIESEANATLKSAPIAQNYQTRLSSLQNVLANVNNDTTYGDLALINGFQKIQDPEGSVREGDVSTIQGAQDRLSKLFGDTKGWWTSEGKLKPEYRKQLAETSINTVNSFGKVYKDYAEQVLAGVEAKKGSRANVAYVPHKDFSISDYFKPDVGDIAAQYRALRAQGLSPQDAGAQLGIK